MSTLTVCYAAKGGSGTTVTAAALALANPNDSVLVDLDGELPAVLGVPDPTGDGITDWSNTHLTPASLDLLLVDVNSTTRLLPHGHQPVCADRWDQFATWLRPRPGATIVDAGTGHPPPQLLAHADQVLLVTRPCFLSLRRGRGQQRPPRRDRAHPRTRPRPDRPRRRRHPPCPSRHHARARPGCRPRRRRAARRPSTAEPPARHRHTPRHLTWARAHPQLPPSNPLRGPGHTAGWEGSHEHR